MHIFPQTQKPRRHSAEKWHSQRLKTVPNAASQAMGSHQAPPQIVWELVDQQSESLPLPLPNLAYPAQQFLYQGQVNIPTDALSFYSAVEEPTFPVDWYDSEYRRGYIESMVAEDIALQIRLNRERRGWSQKDLADRLGTKQSAISRLESPGYGAQSIETLLKVAEAFDCGLELRLVSFSYLFRREKRLNPDYFYVESFEDEAPK